MDDRPAFDRLLGSFEDCPPPLDVRIPDPATVLHTKGSDVHTVAPHE